jgi:hypothetical protein
LNISDEEHPFGYVMDVEKDLKNKNQESEILKLWTFIAHNNNYKIF